MAESPAHPVVIPNDMDFTGKIVLVAGGSSGIGNGIAQAFRKRGAKVHVWGTRASAADYADEPGSDLSGLVYSQVDVGGRGNIDAYAPPFDGLDVLVLCQGLMFYKRAEFQPDGWDKVMAVNIDSVMHCANKFRPMLAKNKGAIITISSTGGLWANKGNPAYAASKAGVISLTKTLAEAWAKEGIRVNGVAPGYVQTKMNAIALEVPGVVDKILENIPLHRPATIDEMAGPVLFLASPLANFICGQTIVVDGGTSIMTR